jgi:uncharacterized protein (DUF427 family)
MRPEPIVPQPGQESVWDYPRPPAIEPCSDRIRVILGGQVIVDTNKGFRVLETSHPPVYYLPILDFHEGVLSPADRQSFCEFKGSASYFHVQGGDQVRPFAAWAYLDPTPRFEDIRSHVAIYAHHMDECWVGERLVKPQPGDFYGGWITDNIVGPFKGGPGTFGW